MNEPTQPPATAALDELHSGLAAASRWHRFQYGVRYFFAFAGGLTVAGVGDYMSFRNLMEYARRHHFASDWGLPVGLDAGIPALLLLDSLRPSRFLRLAAMTLSAGTVVANAAVTPDHSWVTRGLHGLMPGLAIVWYEAIRRINRPQADETKMDRVRLARYLVSPVRTVRIRFRMIRWEVTSYAEALRLESTILLARAVLIAEYGQRDWRRTRRLVPVILRHQLDTGQAPDELTSSPDWQAAVRSWVRDVLEELDASRGADRAGQQGTRPDQTPDPDAAATDPWDLIWDQRDRLIPAGVSPAVFAKAFGLARLNFEQVGAHIKIDDLREELGIQKARATLLARVFKTAYESGPDQAVALLDQRLAARPPAAASAETLPEPAGPDGLAEADPTTAGSPS